jgi:hypothetical protein
MRDVRHNLGNNFMNVVISNNVKKVSERLDRSGNIIDPRTKQVIKPKEVYVAPEVKQEVTPELQKESSETMSLKEVKAEIERTEARLNRLKEQKRIKVEELKKLLEEDL